jgi:dTDP-glucose 4,6-dehydratase
MGNRILVTGGAGAIGRALIEEFKSRSLDVVSCDVLHNENEKGFRVRTDVLEPDYVRCDVTSYRQLERVIKDCGPFDYVYHLAAEFGRWNGEDFYENLWGTNVIGTKNIIRLQEVYGFRMIFFSSSEVYGDFQGVMREDIMDKYEIRQMNDYALSKWTNEGQIRNSLIEKETQTVIVRLFNTYGPGEFYSPYRSVNCRFLYCAMKGLPWEVFKGHSRTSTYVDDTVRTLANIIQNFKPGEIYNISSDQYHTIEELSDIIIEITGASRDLVKFKDSEILTTKNKSVDNSKSVRDLNHYNSVSLEEGIKKTFEWMKCVYV